MWPSASGGARPLPSQPVSCLQTGLRWDPAEHPGVHGYLVRDPGPAFPPTHTPWVTLDKLWNLSETADTPMRWPGLLGKGAAVPEAQQPGRPLWRWREGQGALGRRKLQILRLGGARSLSASPRAPQSSACWGRCCGHTGSAQKTPTSSEQLLTAPHWPDPISRVLPGLTAPRDPSTHPDSPGPRLVQGVPSSTPPRPCPEARLPLHAHLPLRVPSPPGWGQSRVPGAQLGSDPWRAPASISGRNKAFPPGLGAAPLCPCWPAPSQWSMIDGPLTSPVTWALDPSTTTSGLSRVWPPWDPGQSRPAEPFHRAT